MRVLYIDIDSLRPDRLGCYGYDRDTSPTIDGLAADGVVFEECYASDSPCLPSRTALATGRHGIKSGAVTHYGHGQWYNEPGEGHDQDPDRPLSFRYLAESGLYTASISGFSKRHLAYHFGAGFRESVQPTANTGRERAADVTPVAMDWLDRHAADDDWLLHVNYWDVHHPYDDTDDTVSDIRDSGPAPAWPNQGAIDDQQGMTGTRTADLWPSPELMDEFGVEDGLVQHGEWGMPVRITDREDFEHITDGYDASIQVVDDAVDTLLNKLEAEGVREETTVIVSADHGEALGEHGIYAEHSFPHPPCQQVPLIVSGPEIEGGRHVEEKIYQFDLAATLCDLAELDVPDGWDAKSVSDALHGNQFDGRDHLVCGHGIFTFGRAVYRDDWVYIRLLHPGVFSHPGLYNKPDLPSGGLELLHDRNEDPHMTKNCITDRPDVADEMRALHDRWLSWAVSSWGASGEDPLARTAVERGPFLYVDPESLSEYYQENDRSAEQIQAVEQASEFPR